MLESRPRRGRGPWARPPGLTVEPVLSHVAGLPLPLADGVKLQSSAGVNERADWLALPLKSQPPIAAGNRTSAPAISEAVAVPENFYNEQAKRLQGLKMLREQNLISEDEYQLKRQAVIEGL